MLRGERRKMKRTLTMIIISLLCLSTFQVYTSHVKASGLRARAEDMRNNHVSVSIPALVAIDLETLNLKSNGKSITAYVEFPKGFDVNDVNVSSVMLNSTVRAELAPATIGDYDNDATADLMAKFNRTAANQFIVSQGIEFANVTIAVGGQLKDGTTFAGSDTVRVSGLVGDVNCDGKVDFRDLALGAFAFWSRPGEPRWNDNANFAQPWDKIDLCDLAKTARNYGAIARIDTPPGILAGWRSSEYSHQTDLTKAYWINTANAISAKLDASSSGVYVIGEIDFIGENPGPVCYLSFPKPVGTYNNVRFESEDVNEDYLTAFDAAGLKIWLAVEPGDADVSRLMDLVMNQYRHHSCVIGFGIDAEWYQAQSHTEGKPMTATEIQTWLTHLRTIINPHTNKADYLLFVKHFSESHIQNTFQADGLVFIDDSLGHSSYGAMLTEFKSWATYFSKSKVAFQIGYEEDKEPVWAGMQDPVKTIGQALISQNSNCIGIYWVDFSILDIFPK